MRAQMERSARTPLQHSAAGKLVRDFQFSDKFIGFSGHFPGFAILPAVGQMLLAQTMVEEERQCLLPLQRVENAKFIRPIRPDENVRVEIVLDEKENFLRAEVVVSANGETAAKFRQLFSLRESG